MRSRVTTRALPGRAGVLRGQNGRGAGAGVECRGGLHPRSGCRDELRRNVRDGSQRRRGGLCGLKKAPCRACCAVSFVVRVMERGACRFHMRACARTFAALEERSEGEEYLRDSEEKNRRSPQCARQQPGVRHEGHTRRSLLVPGSASMTRPAVIRYSCAVSPAFRGLSRRARASVSRSLWPRATDARHS